MVVVVSPDLVVVHSEDDLTGGKEWGKWKDLCEDVLGTEGLKLEVVEGLIEQVGDSCEEAFWELREKPRASWMGRVRFADELEEGMATALRISGALRPQEYGRQSVKQFEVLSEFAAGIATGHWEHIKEVPSGELPVLLYGLKRALARPAFALTRSKYEEKMANMEGEEGEVEVSLGKVGGLLLS